MHNSTPLDLKVTLKEGTVKKRQVEKSGRRSSVLVPKNTWKERTLCLEEDVLRWKEGRYIRLDQVEAIEPDDEPRTFKVSTHRETLVIQAPSHREKDEWLAALSRQVHLRSEERLASLRRHRAPNTADVELRAYKRLVKTNAMVQRLTTRTLQ